MRGFIISLFILICVVAYLKIKHPDKDFNITAILNSFKTIEYVLKPVPYEVKKFVYGNKNYTREEIDNLIVEYSEKRGLEPILMQAVVQVESNFIQKRKSPYNADTNVDIKSFPISWQKELIDQEQIRETKIAQGLGQLMPQTAANIINKHKIETNSIRDLEDADFNLKITSLHMIDCNNKVPYFKKLILEKKGKKISNIEAFARCYYGNADGRSKDGKRDFTAEREGWIKKFSDGIFTRVVKINKEKQDEE